MATIKEIKGNVRFAIDWATEENYQPLAGYIGEDEAEWVGEALHDEFIKKGLNEVDCAYTADKQDEWLDNKTEELVNDYKILTYDVFFHDDMSTENKGFKMTLEDAMSYVDTFAPYQYKGYEGGVAYVRCNETEEVVYKVDIKNDDEDEPEEMHLKDFSEIYKMLEDEIEDDGVELEEGVKPSVAELLDYYLANSDFFYSIIFKDYDYERNVNHLCELTEDEREQVEKLRRFCKE